jgi:putative salt-induced outer membrane protein YdiY
MFLLTHPSHAQDLNLPSPIESIIGDPIVGSGAIADGDVVPMPANESYSNKRFPETSWITPVQWFSGPIWEKSIELGINGSDGNAQALSLLTAGRLSRETDTSKWGIDIVYAKTEANSIITQHYAFLNSRFDYELGDSRWSLFNITRLEFDEFKAFDVRLAINGGLGYDLISTDTRTLTGRFGAGASREFGSADDQWVPEAVFGADYTHKLTDRQRLSITSDYYPAWEDFKDYRLVTQASWELLLDEETNLSLKVGLLERYDSTPQGRKANDVDYFITLLWKM